MVHADTRDGDACDKSVVSRIIDVFSEINTNKNKSGKAHCSQNLKDKGDCTTPKFDLSVIQEPFSLICCPFDNDVRLSSDNRDSTWSVHVFWHTPSNMIHLCAPFFSSGQTSWFTFSPECAKSKESGGLKLFERELLGIKMTKLLTLLRMFTKSRKEIQPTSNKGAYQHQSHTCCTHDMWARSHSSNFCHKVEHWAQWGLPEKQNKWTSSWPKSYLWCNLFSLAVLSWLVGGGGQFKLLLNCIYATDDDNENDNNAMVTQISRFR